MSSHSLGTLDGEGERQEQSDVTDNIDSGRCLDANSPFSEVFQWVLQKLPTF